MTGTAPEFSFMDMSTPRIADFIIRFDRCANMNGENESQLAQRCREILSLTAALIRFHRLA